MDYNVYIPKILALREQDGTVKLVFLLETALLDFIKKTLLASLSHKGAYLLLSGVMENVLLELNALFGKMGPMASVKGVIHCSVGLVAVMWAVLALV